MMSSYQFKSLQVTQAADHVYQVQLNRPDKRNSINGDMWKYGNYSMLSIKSIQY